MRIPSFHIAPRYRPNAAASHRPPACRRASEGASLFTQTLLSSLVHGKTFGQIRVESMTPSPLQGELIYRRFPAGHGLLTVEYKDGAITALASPVAPVILATHVLPQNDLPLYAEIVKRLNLQAQLDSFFKNPGHHLFLSTTGTMRPGQRSHAVGRRSDAVPLSRGEFTMVMQGKSPWHHVEVEHVQQGVVVTLHHPRAKAGIVAHFTPATIIEDSLRTMLNRAFELQIYEKKTDLTVRIFGVHRPGIACPSLALFKTVFTEVMKADLDVYEVDMQPEVEVSPTGRHILFDAVTGQSNAFVARSTTPPMIRMTATELDWNQNPKSLTAQAAP